MQLFLFIDKFNQNNPFFVLSFSVQCLHTEHKQKERQNDPLQNRVIGITKTSTINRELAVLSHLLNKSIEWGLIEKMPCRINKFKEENERTAYLTVKQIKEVLRIAREDMNPHIYPYIFITNLFGKIQ